MNRPELMVDGVAMRLGNRIGRGGEGDVFLVGDGTRAVKLYTDGKAMEREPKLAAMVRRQLSSSTSLVAFPVALVRDRQGRIQGFTMNLVSGHKPLHELYAPGARKQNFPAATYPFLVRAAQNVARAIATVHASGCVIGDVNHSGILISDRATAAVIDADSFQIRDGSETFFCRVGTPEYTPPELQGKSLAGVTRTPDHDAFGLAVIAFLLLSMGRHPFVGTYRRGDMPLPRAITEHRFAYSRRRNVEMTLPPGVCGIGDFPESVAAAFERAFSPDSHGQRPPAAEWVALLEGFEKGLQQCTANSLHHYAGGKGECPWCRMERRLGVVLFLPNFDVDPRTVPTFSAGEMSVLWAQIEAIPIPSRAALKPVLLATAPAPTAEALAAKRGSPAREGLPYLLYLVAAVLLIVAPVAWLISLGLAVLGYNLRQKRDDFACNLRARHQALEQCWNQALDVWAARSRLVNCERLKADLQDAKNAYSGLGEQEREALAAYQQGRQAAQLKRYLEGFRIADATIRGIGTAKTAVLQSYGIETAAEVLRDDVLAVPGFGPINSRPLLEWRARLEGQFVYRSQATAADQQATAHIRNQTKQSAVVLREKMAAGAKDLYRQAGACAQYLATADPELQRLYAELRQLESDAACTGITLPAIRMAPDLNKVPPAWAMAVQSPARPPPPTSPAQQTSRAPTPTMVGQMGQPNCPLCGRSMIRRTARQGRNAGGQFWGCASYPRCRGTRSI